MIEQKVVVEVAVGKVFSLMAGLAVGSYGLSCEPFAETTAPLSVNHITVSLCVHVGVRQQILNRLQQLSCMQSVCLLQHVHQIKECVL